MMRHFLRGGRGFVGGACDGDDCRQSLRSPSRMRPRGHSANARSPSSSAEYSTPDWTSRSIASTALKHPKTRHESQLNGSKYPRITVDLKNIYLTFSGKNEYRPSAIGASHSEIF